eukprot:9359245-Pyramimonas_sp.AAC.1
MAAKCCVSAQLRQLENGVWPRMTHSTPSWSVSWTLLAHEFRQALTPISLDPPGGWLREEVVDLRADLERPLRLSRARAGRSSTAYSMLSRAIKFPAVRRSSSSARHEKTPKHRAAIGRIGALVWSPRNDLPMAGIAIDPFV